MDESPGPAPCSRSSWALGEFALWEGGEGLDGMLVVSVVAQVSDQLQMVSMNRMIVIFVNIGRNAPNNL